MRPDSDVLHKSFTYLYHALIIGRSFPGQRSQEATKPGFSFCCCFFCIIVYFVMGACLILWC